VNLLDLELPELEELLARLGHKPFRARQLWQWLWQKNAATFEEMTNLSKDLRAQLAAAAAIRPPRIADARASSDGTVKLLLRLGDGEVVETVLIPEKDHYTQCLSTQAGCAMGCTFCSTGRMGLVRNMTMAEIVGQVLVGRRRLAETGVALPLRNLVFMGMGEPLMNTRELLRALRTLSHPLGLDFSPRRMTVSTCGLPAGMRELGASGLASLAVSLHAPTQELRAQLMPAAAKVPLHELIDALKDYPLKNRQRITFEYILLKGVNDTPEHARQLVRLLSHLKCKINLIAFNAPRDGSGPYQAPGPERILAFEKALWDKNITVILRKSKGADIAAACGQLRTEHKTGRADPKT
jgi:23S rRNA (adenine2503-C2)-methyltransferase